MGGAASILLDTELTEGLAPETCLEHALRAERVIDVGNLVCGFYWGEIKRRGVYVELGYPSLEHLIRARSHESVRTIEERISTARELMVLELTRAAFGAGTLKWAAVRAIARVATRETEGAWVEWSIGKRTSVVERNAAHREKGELPTDPKRRQITTPRAYRGARLNPAELELFDRVRAMLQELFDHPVTDREVIVFLTSLVARMRPDGTIPGWSVVAERPYLVHLNQDAGGLLYVQGQDGEPVAIDMETLTGMARFPFQSKEVAEALRPAQVDRVDIAALDPENTGELVPEDARDAPTPAALRERVLARDGYRCRACGSCQDLAAHHRRWRSYGGRTVLSNLMTVCLRCHSLIHARLLIVLGPPDGELRFLDRRGRPTERHRSSPVEIPVVRAPGALDDHRPVSAPLASPPSQPEPAPSVFAPSEPPPPPPPAPPVPAVRLTDVVGQDGARARIGSAIEAARKRGGTPQHFLLCGPPGVGKTFMAEAAAGELEAPFVSLPAPRVKTNEALLEVLVSLRPGSVLFMDELHALPRLVAEGILYEALDRGTVTVPVHDGEASGTHTAPLAPFTFIGATTDEDLLPRALLSRLRREQLELYSVAQLAELLGRAAGRHGLELEPEAAALLAGASRESPRQALSLLLDARDQAILAGTSRIDAALAERTLTARGIDERGLDALDRAYLEELTRAKGPRSSSTLAARLGVSEGRLAVHESFLIRRGLVLITSQGRVLA